LNEARQQLTHEQQESVVVKQTLKAQLMNNPFDLRGRRHLLTVLEMYQICKRSMDYSPGLVKMMKRRLTSRVDNTDYYPPLGWVTKTKVGVTCVILPCSTIVADMGWSDLKVLVGLRNYVDNITTSDARTEYLVPDYQNQRPAYQTVEGLWLVLVVIYVISCVTMVFSPFLSSIKSTYITDLSMADIQKEQAGTAVPLASITRFDLSLEEAGFESCFQLQMQWCIYITIQIVVVTNGVQRDESFHFQTLLISGLLSLWSLTMGQLKLNLSTQNAETAPAVEVVTPLQGL